MGLGHCKGGRAAGQRDKVVIKPFRVGKVHPWAEEDPKGFKEYQAQWYQMNKEQEKARQANYRKLKREELNHKRRERYEKTGK